MIGQYHAGMRACVWLHDGECSDMFDVEQGIRRGCVLAPMLFNMFFTAAVLSVTEEHFTADAAILDSSMVKLQRKENGKRRGGGNGQEEEARTLWGMLYADDAGIASRSPEWSEKMTTVIVTACATFGLTVSEAKTEIMCLQTKGGGKRAVHPYCSRPGVQTNGRVWCTWAGLPAKISTFEVSR